MSELSTDSIEELFMRLRSDGVSTPELADWRNKQLGAILLATESGACYVIEPVPTQPSLITRFAEVAPYYGQFRLPSSEMILRRQGYPDDGLVVGKPVDIYGLPRRGTDFDHDSMYTTTPLVEIKYLESSAD